MESIPFSQQMLMDHLSTLCLAPCQVLGRQRQAEVAVVMLTVEGGYSHRKVTTWHHKSSDGSVYEVSGNRVVKGES